MHDRFLFPLKCLLRIQLNCVLWDFESRGWPGSWSLSCLSCYVTVGLTGSSSEEAAVAMSAVLSEAQGTAQRLLQRAIVLGSAERRSWAFFLDQANFAFPPLALGPLITNFLPHFRETSHFCQSSWLHGVILNLDENVGSCPLLSPPCPLSTA